MKSFLALTFLPVIVLLAISPTYFFGAQPANADTVDILNTSIAKRSATGFFGRDDQGDLVADRSGIMLVFDYPIVHDSVSLDDFWVQTDDGAYASVVDVHVSVNLVFLKLFIELASSATPALGMNDNQFVELDVGNSIERLSFAGVEINDGIPPTLAMTLSGGSGTGTGDESPERLTKDKIDITVTSDEPLHEPPRITIVCNDIQWTEIDDSAVIRNNIDNFIDNRSGQLAEPQSTNPDSLNDEPPDYWCGEDQDIALTTQPMIANSATSWTYQWRKPTEAPHKLSDGLQTAIAHARDRSEYQHHHDRQTIRRWSAASADFTLDTILKSPLEEGGGGTYPNGRMKFYLHEGIEAIFVKFAEITSVTLHSFELDGASFLDQVETVEDSHASFVYWPSKLETGVHKISVTASDAAGNSIDFTWSFEVNLRPPFVLRLQPGWNAVSFPANPIDNNIASIFTNPSIRYLAAWHPHGFPEQFLISNRLRGVWVTDWQRDFQMSIDVRYGYWVYSQDAIEQPVRLRPSRICNDQCPFFDNPYIFPGWNFLGAIDYDNDQIEDHFGDVLIDSASSPITGREHLGDRYEIAYRWDAHTQAFERLHPDDPVRIGEAIWVYYPKPGER